MLSRRVLSAVCRCGGWVMVAVLHEDPKKNADHYKEAASMAAEGFAISETTVDAVRSGELPSCKHRGDCTTNQKRARKAIAALERTKDPLAAPPASCGGLPAKAGGHKRVLQYVFSLIRRISSTE